jgi:hypothetical protein
VLMIRVVMIMVITVMVLMIVRMIMAVLVAAAHSAANIAWLAYRPRRRAVRRTQVLCAFPDPGTKRATLPASGQPVP